MAQPQQKKIPCMSFRQTGMCRLGSACRFAHDKKYAYTPPTYTNRAWSSGLASTSSRQAEGEVGAQESYPFSLMSYNTLADALAIEHAPELYKAVPTACLQWERRKKQLLDEILHWRPDVICLQEIDHPADFTDVLSQLGYEWRHGARSGGRPDGLLTLWQAAKFEAVAWDCIQMQEHSLKDNVALIVVLRAQRASPPADGAAESAGQLGPCMAVANSHLLFNPKRGDIKLGQAGTVLRRMAAMFKELSVRPLAIFTGDFNSTPGSAIYSFIQQGRLECLALDRRNLSGQLEVDQRAGGVPQSTGKLRQGFSAQQQRRAPSYSPRPQGLGRMPQQQSSGFTPRQQSSGSAPHIASAPRSGSNLRQQSPAQHPAGPSSIVQESAGTQNARHEESPGGRGPLGQENWLAAQQVSESRPSSSTPGKQKLPRQASASRSGGLEGGQQEQAVRQLSEDKDSGVHQRSVRQALDASAEALGLPEPSHGLDEKGIKIAETSRPVPPARFPHCSSFPLVNPSLRGSGVEENYGMGIGQGRPVFLPGQGSMYSYKDKFGQVVWSHVPPTDTDLKRQPFFLDPMRMEEPAPQLSPPPPGIFRTLSFAQQQMMARTWSTENLALATGIRDKDGSLRALRSWTDYASPEDIWVALHPLPMQSAYRTVLGSEPAFTSCHGKFIGTVDYLWFTPQAAGGLSLTPTSVLLPPPLESLPHGLPSAEWPSDHISLLASFTLADKAEGEPEMPPSPPPPPPARGAAAAVVVATADFRGAKSAAIAAVSVAPAPISTKGEKQVRVLQAGTERQVVAELKSHHTYPA